MIKTIGFRRLLPVANCVLYVLLMCFDNSRGIASAHAASPVHAVPILLRFVLAVNVPAVLTAYALDAAVFRFQLRNPLLLTIPFIPLLWYPVGSWIDRGIGWSPRRKYIRTRPRDALLASAVVIACLAIVVFVQTIKLLSPGPTDPFWMGYGVSLWFVFLLAVLARMIYIRAADS